VINGENYHVLEALTLTCSGAIDCIYIDPPYNSRDKQWKYNNDYVDSDDDYRHSKWLAMMERRLKVAQDLLNPDDSALIVTIDEREVSRLGLLLEQTFPVSSRASCSAASGAGISVQTACPLSAVRRVSRNGPTRAERRSASRTLATWRRR
jgi:adenine-specific DNA-methyltransferase